MNRGWPIALLAFFFLYLGVTVSSTVLWLITGFAVLLLIGLIGLMYYKDQFVGPGTLIDDARDIRDRFIQTDSNGNIVDDQSDDHDDRRYR